MMTKYSNIVWDLIQYVIMKFKWNMTLPFPFKLWHSFHFLSLLSFWRNHKWSYLTRSSRLNIYKNIIKEIQKEKMDERKQNYERVLSVDPKNSCMWIFNQKIFKISLTLWQRVILGSVYKCINARQLEIYIGFFCSIVSI